MWTYNPYYEKYLAHYGVKGMHWGEVHEEEAAKRRRMNMVLSNAQKQKKAQRDAAAKRFSSHMQAQTTAASRFAADQAKIRNDISNRQAAAARAKGYAAENPRDEAGIRMEQYYANKKGNENQRRKQLDKQKDYQLHWLDEHMTDADAAKELMPLRKMLITANSPDEIEKALATIGRILGGNDGAHGYMGHLNNRR